MKLSWVFFFLSFPGALFVPTRLLWSQSCVPGWPELCHTGRDNTHIDSYKGVGCSGRRSERFPRNSSPRPAEAFVRLTIFSQLDVGWFRQSNYMDKTRLQGCFQEQVDASVPQNEPTHLCEKIALQLLVPTISLSGYLPNSRAALSRILMFFVRRIKPIYRCHWIHISRW